MAAEKVRERTKNVFVRAGDRVSDWTSRLFAHAALSVLAITLTQMVLNGQYDREAEAHRRDVAMHAKLDELIKATNRARDEMVGIEEDLDEEQIQELREEAKELVEAAARRTNDVADGEKAKRAIERVGDGK
jgi:low affinity Fe/Cu permease